MSQSPHYDEFTYIGKHRRAVEHRRFVVGKGNYAGDVLKSGTLHVAIVASPYASAKILKIDAAAALAIPGVEAVVTGAEINSAVLPVLPGVDAPSVKRFPLAHEVTRYSGEWVCVVVATSRAIAEDAAELIQVDYEELPYVLDPEIAINDHSHHVHTDAGTNLIFNRQFVWGPVEEDFS